MKKNELISMVDFVFRCDNLYPPMNELEVTNTVHEYGKIKNYANFLNQQLNISMFVPAIKVGDKWEVLEMPKFALNRFEGTHTSSTAYWSAKMQYLTVKDKTLFTGFDSVRFVNDIIIIKHGSYVGKFHISCKIEMLIGLKFLELTNNGQKESGYK